MDDTNIQKPELFAITSAEVDLVIDVVRRSIHAHRG